ncbi:MULTISPECIES: pyridoxine 5'-phosphate synthase [Leisingera]|jgi:pyridoxine 5-phosphate synthase|uniref:pyridoxine 5'-phosphate synthase n=1 Tax=Leisingera TaxID=191028 RepID=UPI00114FBF9D|nr:MULTISPECIES: pyridoxine 5'-phosphate synthase [Leisingera]QDI75559.1 pyridoxine 5'-phosphate synthase [Leisingera aquaemixtae]UWQ35861.1 pyridoxine 5'-phosphate synthase [Leisingera aquaemixtae]
MTQPVSSRPTLLSVNVNAVAYLRNRREVPWPNLTDIARAILQAGAHGITVHPRPDERHIRFSDLPDLSRLIAEEFPQAEFNIEGYPTRHFIDLVLENKPHQVTLVPDTPEQSTSDHGWDFAADGGMLLPVAQEFKAAGIRVSYFVDANPADPALAQQAGADRIEFYTGPYADQTSPDATGRELARIKATADAARQLGTAGASTALMMNAGHDLTVDNLPALRQAIPDLAEVSIGHAITADALMLGFPEAVRRYLRVLGHAA